MATSPIGLKVLLLGVDLPTVTSAELAFAKANDVCVLLAAGQGASASQRIVDQTRTYSGAEAAASFSIVYLVNRAYSALYTMAVNKAAKQEVLRANAAGAAEVDGTLDQVLSSMADAGHFQPGTSGTEPNTEVLPNGYRTLTTPIGTTLSADVLVRFGPEATGISLGITGEIAVES